MWGAAWAKRAPLVLVLSPLAQLMAQTLLVTGLSPMADGLLAASAITLGLFFFSLGRAGIAVAQHSMLARTFTTNLAFAFSVVVACTQLISGACAWSVPRILAIYHAGRDPYHDVSLGVSLGGAASALSTERVHAISSVGIGGGGGGGGAGGGDDGGGGGGSGGALQAVQLVLLLPHIVSSVAGAMLALQHVSVASTLPKGQPSHPALTSHGVGES